MTESDKQLIMRIRAQQTLGMGIWLNEEEFVQWAMNEYKLTRDQITALAKESI